MRRLSCAVKLSPRHTQYDASARAQSYSKRFGPHVVGDRRVLNERSLVKITNVADDSTCLPRVERTVRDSTAHVRIPRVQCPVESANSTVVTSGFLRGVTPGKSDGRSL